MAVDTTLTLLKARIATINPAPEPVPDPAAIVTSPDEALVSGDFPSILICEAPNVDGDFRAQGLGDWHHHYTVLIMLFLGMRVTGLGEVHNRAKYWIKPLAQVLVADLTLGGNVVILGPNDPSQPLF